MKVALLPQPIFNFGNSRKARDYRRELVDPPNHYSEEELRSRYPFGTEGINVIVELLSDDITPLSKRNHPLLATDQVLVTETHFYRTISQRSVESIAE